MSNLETNLQDVEKIITRFRTEALPHFIDGKADPGRSGEVFESL